MKKSIDQIKGTVAYTFANHMHEINFNASLGALKAQVIEMLKSPEITRRADADKYIRDVQAMRNKNVLMSTVCTYATGMKVS
jgi:stalled ribosome rescue protein Dom34